MAEVDARQKQMEAFLQTPDAYGQPSHVSVSRIDTHISAVFLVGERAYKLKKPVDFGYLDFTSLEKRHQACLHELELNRRTAPDIYLSVVPVRLVGARFALGPGKGPVIDWLLEMVRFQQSDVLANKAADDALTRQTVEALARAVHAFHDAAEVRKDAGGAERFAQILASSAENFAPFIGPVYSDGLISRLNAKASATLQRVHALLDDRRAAGWVRHCHGDLHLGNVALINGEPVPFDCIEFNDNFARIDILYDLAFLLMDLSFRATTNARLAGFANAVLNAYLQSSSQAELKSMVEGLQALPLFMSTRAGVRSHVNARTWESLDEGEDKSVARADALSYAVYALELLTPPEPVLYAVGGLSGTGKSTVAKALAPLIGGPTGAVHLRSDVLRKKLAGVDVTDRLPSSAYTQKASDAVYAEMNALAVCALKAGQPVICDAVFSRPDERAAIEKCAEAAGVPFAGLWLSAPSSTLKTRVEHRAREEQDASDATQEVVAQQLSYELGEIGWNQVESGGSREAVLALSAKALIITLP